MAIVAARSLFNSPLLVLTLVSYSNLAEQLTSAMMSHGLFQFNITEDTFLAFINSSILTRGYCYVL